MKAIKSFLNAVRKIITRSLMVIGALFIAIAVMVGIGISIKKEADRIPESNVFLRLDFPGGITEYSSDDELVAELFGRKLSMPDLLDALEKAAADKRVTGIISKIDSVSLSYAQVQEIRKAIEKFKKSGKGLYAWSETFGEVGKGTKSYYLASVYDKIYLQHSGVLGFTGLAAESMFVRGLFDKLGVEVQGGHRKEYKTYWNMFVEKEMTKYHRESADRMVQSLFDQIVKDVGVDRKIEKDALLAIVDKAPLFSKEALDGGLIDGVKYRDEVYDSIDKKHGKSKFISISAYVNEMIRERVEKADAKNVALIYGGGGIKRGKSEYDPSGASSSIGSDTMSKAIRDAVEDKDVDAILIRIDSPGGSVIASEVVWREVIKAKEKGKPVVVSMSSLAASGGYYISMGADRIFAQPATLTGSIGVVVGKLYTLPFWEKIGIDFDSVQKGKNSMIFSSSKSLTEEQKAHMNRVLDTIYNDFVARAAEGRKMPFEKLEEVAKGRVWTGADALERGLVDEMGGYREALAWIRKKLNVKADEPVNIKYFPEKPTFLDILFGDHNGDYSVKIGRIVEIMDLFAPVLDMKAKADRAGAGTIEARMD